MIKNAASNKETSKDHRGQAIVANRDRKDRGEIPIVSHSKGQINRRVSASKGHVANNVHRSKIRIDHPVHHSKVEAEIVLLSNAHHSKIKTDHQDHRKTVGHGPRVNQADRAKINNQITHVHSGK